MIRDLSDEHLNPTSDSAPNVAAPNPCLINIYILSLRIQVCPKEGINPTILLWGWDWDHQSYSREGSGFLGYIYIYVLSPGRSISSQLQNSGISKLKSKDIS